MLTAEVLALTTSVDRHVAASTPLVRVAVSVLMYVSNRSPSIQVTPAPPTLTEEVVAFVTVDNRSDVRDFLASRRARITPERAGLPAFGANRRVPGLRREEVALLAGVSVDYYTRLERGNLNGVSDSVLEALAGALQLDEAERAHLLDLARAANATRRGRRRPGQQLVRPSVQRILDAMIVTPAYVRNGRRDILATNRLGYALYSEAYIDPARPVNIARFVFLSPRARAFFINWESAANDTVAILRTEAGRNPYDQGLTNLVGELSTRSDEFRTRWASHNVRLHRTGFKDIHHPVVGDLHLSFDAMDLPADPGLSVVVYSAEPGSASEDALSLLASWSATLDQTELAGDHVT
jgi:transcriptional regulator with XRE-family HTH domain